MIIHNHSPSLSISLFLSVLLLLSLYIYMCVPPPSPPIHTCTHTFKGHVSEIRNAYRSNLQDVLRSLLSRLPASHIVVGGPTLYGELPRGMVCRHTVLSCNVTHLLRLRLGMIMMMMIMLVMMMTMMMIMKIKMMVVMMIR